MRRHTRIMHRLQRLLLQRRGASGPARSTWQGLQRLESRVLLSGTTPAWLLNGPLAAVVKPLTPAAPAGGQSEAYIQAQQRLQQPGGFLSAPASGDTLALAMEYLHAHLQELGLRPADLAGARVASQYTDATTGITHINLRQTLHGLDIVNADLGIHVDGAGRIIHVTSSFVGGSGVKDTGRPAATVDAAAAYVSLGVAKGLSFTSVPQPIDRQATHAESALMLSSAGAALSDVPAQLVYVTGPSGLELAWQLSVQTTDGAHWYDGYVSADSGGVLFAHDYADHATYNVYPFPVESPADGTRVIVTDPFDPIASPFGWHDTNGVVGAEYTDTRGNNVFAQEDADADDLNGLRPDGGAGQNFDFALNLGQDPSTYPSAAITNLFYWTNLLHDIYYAYGFTEAAGNFQVNNYGRGGVEGDPLFADAHDGDGLNNGLMLTPPDGQSPRMQVYLFNQSNPRRDGVLDSTIVIHEFAHGVSRRLTGGPANSASLDTVQSAAMSEGWSDWAAIMLTQVAGDGKLDAYPVGAYAFNRAEGVRRYPYSFDMAINPLTFADFNGGLPNNESHNAGEIWCSALWDMNWLLVDKYGYSADLAQGQGGNNLALRLVIEGLKLQGANPSFLAGRDAILAADVALNGGANQAEIWTAFARRGMGFSANDGGNSNAYTVTEAFDLPPLGAITGNVFRDDDGNGLRSGVEPALPGWTVFRDINQNGLLDQANTLTTVASADVPKTITDRGTTYSSLTISDVPGVITDINVKVNLTHPYDGELYLTLLSPGNTPIILSNYQGGSGSNFTQTVFDDEAATAISAGSAPFTGSYRPYFNLSQLDNISPNGTWRLRMDDALAGNVGTLLSWSLEISHYATEPSTTTDGQGNFAFNNLGDGVYQIRQVAQAGYTLTAPASGAYDVTITGGQPVVGRNFANQSTVASAAPGVPDLVDASDTGVSSLDNLTRLDNSSPGAALTFNVPNTISGALVQLLADGVVIGSATANGSTTTIVTQGSVDLLDGLRQITARQTVSGLAMSQPSPALTIQVDTQAPLVAVDQALAQPDPTTASTIYFTCVFSEPVYGLGSDDIVIGGSALATSAFVGSGTSLFNFAITGMSQSGTVTAFIGAGAAVDAAGNPSLDATSTDNTVTYGSPAPEIAVAGNGSDITDGDATPGLGDGTDFGSTRKDTAAVVRTFTVTNTGAGTLTLGPISLPNGFAPGSDALAATLAPGASDTFSVQLLTTVVGVFAGEVSISNNDVDENPFNFRITGVVSPLVDTKPTITSITDSPDPVVLGNTLTLTANGVSDVDPGDAVTLVEFYRDANGNGTLDAATDTLLGSDSDASGGWSWSGSTAALPAGTNRYFARAFDGELWSASVTTTGLVNRAPSITSLTVSPTLVVKGSNLTLTAAGVSDSAPGTVSAVEFYRDANGNGRIDVGTDPLLGSDTSSSGGWNKVVSTSSFPAGNVTLMARVKDNNNAYSATVLATTFVNTAPTVGGLTDSPDPLVIGKPLTLSATTVADVDGSVVLAEFYRDVNGNSLVDVGIDTLLGSDASSTGGWSVVAPAEVTALIPAGSNRYLTRVQDNLGAWSTVRTTLGVASNPPVVTNLAAAPSPVNKGSNLTLTATGASDPDTAAGQYVGAMLFYRDSNGNGVWDTSDSLLTTDSAGSDGWKWTGSTSGFAAGVNRFFARARDNTGVYSTSPAVVDVLVNALPTIGSLTDSPDPLIAGNALTLKASSVADADGSVVKVEFYRDLNGNSLIDPAIDQLLGFDDILSNGWSLVVPGTVTVNFASGSARYLARALDNLGAWSTARSTTGTVSVS
jgi:subtilisin-like proprotein convertase family protein